jgi:hypothetical protein
MIRRPDTTIVPSSRVDPTGLQGHGRDRTSRIDPDGDGPGQLRAFGPTGSTRWRRTLDPEIEPLNEAMHQVEDAAVRARLVFDLT